MVFQELFLINASHLEIKLHYEMEQLYQAAKERKSKGSIPDYTSNRD